MLCSIILIIIAIIPPPTEAKKVRKMNAKGKIKWNCVFSVSLNACGTQQINNK